MPSLAERIRPTGLGGYDQTTPGVPRNDHRPRPLFTAQLSLEKAAQLPTRAMGPGSSKQTAVGDAKWLPTIWAVKLDSPELGGPLLIIAPGLAAHGRDIGSGQEAKKTIKRAPVAKFDRIPIAKIKTGTPQRL